MFSLAKFAALGALALATLTAAAPNRLDSKNLVARGDKKGDYKYYDYNSDNVEVELVVVIVEVDKKDFVCILIDDKDDHKKGDDKKDHGKKGDKYDDEFIVKIKDFEFLCVEVDFKDWKSYDFGYKKIDYKKGDDKKDYEDDKKH